MFTKTSLILTDLFWYYNTVVLISLLVGYSPALNADHRHPLINCIIPCQVIIPTFDTLHHELRGNFV